MAAGDFTTVAPYVRRVKFYSGLFDWFLPRKRFEALIRDRANNVEGYPRATETFSTPAKSAEGHELYLRYGEEVQRALLHRHCPCEEAWTHVFRSLPNVEHIGIHTMCNDEGCSWTDNIEHVRALLSEFYPELKLRTTFGSETYQRRSAEGISKVNHEVASFVQFAWENTRIAPSSLLFSGEFPVYGFPRGNYERLQQIAIRWAITDYGLLEEEWFEQTDEEQVAWFDSVIADTLQGMLEKCSTSLKDLELYGVENGSFVRRTMKWPPSSDWSIQLPALKSLSLRGVEVRSEAFSRSLDLTPQLIRLHVQEIGATDGESGWLLISNALRERWPRFEGITLNESYILWVRKNPLLSDEVSSLPAYLAR